MPVPQQLEEPSSRIPGLRMLAKRPGVRAVLCRFWLETDNLTGSFGRAGGVESLDSRKRFSYIDYQYRQSL